MNLTAHQFKTDVWHLRRRIGILWALYLAGEILLFAPWQPHTITALAVLLLVFQVLFGGVLIAAVLHADPLVGTSAAWLTRPTRRQHLFLAKTLFLTAILVVPRLLADTAGLLLRGYSGPVLLLTLAEVAMWTVGIVLVVAALASFTRTLWQFLLAIVGAVVVMCAWTIATEIMDRAGLIDQAGALWWAVESGRMSRLIAAVGVAGFGALGAWIFHGMLRRSSLAAGCYAAGLLAFPVILVAWKWNFLQPHLTLVRPPEVRLVETSLPPGAQRIANELAVTGIRSDQVAVLQEMLPVVQFTNGHVMKVQLMPGLARKSPANSDQAERYIHLIRGHFPENTLWLGGVPDIQPSVFIDADSRERYGHSLPPAYVSGTFELDLFSARKTAELPVRRGAFFTAPGERIRIESVRVDLNGIRVDLHETVARPTFDRRALHAFGRQGAGPWDLRTSRSYVLYHPIHREALLVTGAGRSAHVPGVFHPEQTTSFSFQFPYSALRERLTGISAPDWLKEARLVVFIPVYEGTAHASLRTTLYTWQTPERTIAPGATGLPAIREAQLAANASTADVASYLDTLFDNAPLYPSGEAVDLLRAKLEAVGPEGVPLLLERLPVPTGLEERCVIPALRRLIRRHHLPDLSRCLTRDLTPLRALPDPSWESELRPTLLQVLRERQLPATPDAVRIVAEGCDPATFPELHWHFVHLERSRGALIPALERCKDFPLETAVREAWKRVQLGILSDSDVTVAAARLRLPGALTEAILNLESAPAGADRERRLKIVAEAAGYSGPASNALPWLSANVGRLEMSR